MNPETSIWVFEDPAPHHHAYFFLRVIWWFFDTAQRKVYHMVGCASNFIPWSQMIPLCQAPSRCERTLRSGISQGGGPLHSNAPMFLQVFKLMHEREQIHLRIFEISIYRLQNGRFPLMIRHYTISLVQRSGGAYLFFWGMQAESTICWEHEKYTFSVRVDPRQTHTWDWTARSRIIYNNKNMKKRTTKKNMNHGNMKNGHCYRGCSI